MTDLLIALAGASLGIGYTIGRVGGYHHARRSASVRPYTCTCGHPISMHPMRDCRPEGGLHAG